MLSCQICCFLGLPSGGVGGLCGGDGVEGGVLVDSYGAWDALREGSLDLGGAGGEVCDGCHFWGLLMGSCEEWCEI